jgi:hypothetical protein
MVASLISRYHSAFRAGYWVQIEAVSFYYGENAIVIFNTILTGCRYGELKTDDE